MADEYVERMEELVSLRLCHASQLDVIHGTVHAHSATCHNMREEHLNRHWAGHVHIAYRVDTAIPYVSHIVDG